MHAVTGWTRHTRRACKPSHGTEILPVQHSAAPIPSHRGTPRRTSPNRPMGQEAEPAGKRGRADSDPRTSLAGPPARGRGALDPVRGVTRHPSSLRSCRCWPRVALGNASPRRIRHKCSSSSLSSALRRMRREATATRCRDHRVPSTAAGLADYICNTYICTYIYIYIYTHIDVYVYIYIYIYIYTRI